MALVEKECRVLAKSHSWNVACKEYPLLWPRPGTVRRVKGGKYEYLPGTQQTGNLALLKVKHAERLEEFKVICPRLFFIARGADWSELFAPPFGLARAGAGPGPG